VHRCWGLPVPFYPQMRLGLAHRRLGKELSAFAPHIVHLVTEYSMGWTGLCWARRRGVPVAASFHTDIPGYLSFYGFPFLSSLAWQYIAWFHRQCLVNFYPCEVYGDILKSLGVPNLVRWGRGVDTEAFHPRHRDEAWRRSWGPGPLLLYVGRLALEKEPQVAMAALKFIREEFPQAKLLMAGEGPLQGKLEREAQEGVVLLGLAKGRDLSRLYASCDLFLFPSVTETYGNVILEAMASGLPVVAPLAGGVKENLIPGYNGCPCEPHSPRDMARAALQILKNTQLKEALSRQARSHAEERTWEKALGIVLDTYIKITSGSAALKAS